MAAAGWCKRHTRFCTKLPTPYRFDQRTLRMAEDDSPAAPPEPGSSAGVVQGEVRPLDTQDVDSPANREPNRPRFSSLDDRLGERTTKLAIFQQPVKVLRFVLQLLDWQNKHRVKIVLAAYTTRQSRFSPYLEHAVLLFQRYNQSAGSTATRELL